VASFESTGLPDGIADAVMCIDSYEFESSLDALFGEMWRVTRPGGWLVLTGRCAESCLTMISRQLRSRTP
jgi:hypothetical protein